MTSFVKGQSLFSKLQNLVNKILERAKYKWQFPILGTHETLRKCASQRAKQTLSAMHIWAALILLDSVLHSTA